MRELTVSLSCLEQLKDLPGPCHGLSIGNDIADDERARLANGLKGGVRTKVVAKRLEGNFGCTVLHQYQLRFFRRDACECHLRLRTWRARER